MDKNARRETAKQNRLDASNQKLVSNKGIVSGGHDDASWLSTIFLLWVNPLVQLAHDRPLEMKSLFPLPKGSDSESLLKRFDEAWGEQMMLPKGTRSLGRALWKCFKPAVILSGWMFAGMYVAIIAVPLIIQQILLWVTREENGKAQGWDLCRGLFFAFLLLLVGFVGSGLMNHHALLMLFKLGMEVRSTINGATFAKSLRLSNKARQRTTVGAMVTLMSNDAQRLPDAIPFCHGIWSGPTVIIILITIIIKIIGVAALPGIAFLVLMIPVQMIMVKLQIGVQQAQVEQTQSRIKVVNDVLQGIRIVKYYAWEALFMQRIESLRNLELRKVKHFAFLQAYNLAFMHTTPYIMVMLTSITYYNMTGEFEPDVVFTAASLLLVLAMPLMMLPMAVAGFVQAKVSLSRLQNFLELDEVCEDDRLWTHRDGNAKGCGSISITGKFVWRPDDEESEVGTATEWDDGEEAGRDYEDNEESEDVDREKWELDVENLDIPSGKLVSVIGQVGSGKSSLVSAILGEMTKVEGTVTVDGSLAYVAQTAWIINASVKENILMGRAYDHARYRKVIRVCDLHQDLAVLPEGDKTEIGEKGINLSGGQKQRISLARAAYANADVYILDDPLSAVDARVGRHLFDSCLAGLLKGKTILLCTNHLHFVPRADLVLFMQSGHIIRRGSYFDLVMENDATLNRFLETSKMDDQEFKEESTQEEEKACNQLGSSRRPCLSSDAAGRPWLVATPRTPAPVSQKRSRSRSRTHTPWSFGSAYGWRMAARAASDASAGMVEGSFPGEGVMNEIDSDLAERILNTSGHHRGVGSSNYVDRYDMDADSLVRLYSDASAYEDLDVHTHRRSRTGSARGQVGLLKSKLTTSSGVSELSKSGEVDSAVVLQTVEGQAEGAVKWKIFRTYFRDGSGGWGLPMVLLAMTVVTQAISNYFEYWLSYWSDAYVDSLLADEEKPPSWYQFIYIGLCLFTVGMHLLRGMLFAVQAAMSSKFMHAALARGVIRAPVSFFDVTPVGRVLNRFTKDIDVMDLLLPRNIPQFVSLLATIIGSMVVIVLVLPLFAFVAMPVIFGFIWVLECYRPLSRDLQRLESMSRSPIVALFSETLNGVSTLRAYNQQEHFIERNNRILNGSASTFYHMHCANRWLGIRLKAMGSFMNFAAAFIIVMLDYTDSFYVSAGVAGLVLLYTQQDVLRAVESPTHVEDIAIYHDFAGTLCPLFTKNMSWMVRMGCETEARITSVERAKEYAELKPEADLIVDNNSRPPTGWPETGALQMTSVEMRYRPELDLVLQGVTLDVKASERVGIAGRTGSGKSSLMVALFRIVEPCGGTITIDGVNATHIRLQDLREAISIIPQDPVMFCGTMRQNLDPFGRYSDPAIWTALGAGMLGSYVSGLQGKLESEVSEGGANLSLGQRQLFCLARAVLRRSKILVMDEATANLDLETDALIQRAIREEFSGCTILTIAHRIETIMDSDRILVMKDGKVGEFDTPANLVAREKSLLMDLIRQTGSESARRLVSIANGSMEPGCSIAVPESLAELASVDEAGIVELVISNIDGSDGAMASGGLADDSDDGISSPSAPTTEVSDSQSSMGDGIETAHGTLKSGDDCMNDAISYYKLEGPQATSGVLHDIERFKKQSLQELGVQPIDRESSDRMGGDPHPTE